MEETTPPPFCIGHHESKRTLPITVETVQEAHNANYDMLTCPITTPLFHSRVLSLLSSHLSQLSNNIHPGLSTPPAISLPPLGPADTPLTPDDTISQLVGLSSPWIDLSSSDPLIADISRQVLNLEMKYAAFCGLTCVIIPGPRLDGRGPGKEGVTRYARAILDSLSDGPFIHIYIWSRMNDVAGEQPDNMGDLRPFAREQYQSKSTEIQQHELFGSWETWDIIRSICKYSSRLSIALSIPSQPPPLSVQSRWYSEPVRIITIDSTTFVPNAKGYPVLSRNHQNLISQFVKAKTAPWFILCDVGPIPSVLGDINSTSNGIRPDDDTEFPSLTDASTQKVIRDPTPHLSYMRNLQDKQPLLTAIDKFSFGYQDYLQAPLQPLTVNLESITYEVFEKDPIKYDWYERAIARALNDWVENGKPTSNPDGRVVVAVVGAGRGPLVSRALKASEDVGVEIDMWALEKNPNAFVLLQRHNATTWNGKVNLVRSDMRTWRGPVHHRDPAQIRKTYNLDMDDDDIDGQFQSNITASQDLPPSQATTHPPTFYNIDILISELLGSFGDNELSPECLDGVQHLMNPHHGLSIPSSYTAFLTPIAAPKLHADISTMINAGNSTSHAAEIPYVVMLNAIDYLSLHDNDKPSINDANSHPEPVILPTWIFQHPNRQLSSLQDSPSTTNAHNRRHVTLTFPIPNRATCHGLAGYFEAELYDGVELSTNPNTMPGKSDNMISWFPIYFPLKTPLTIPDNATLQINMWRQTDDRKVWYEWIVDVYLDIPISTSGPTDQKSTEDNAKAHKSVNSPTTRRIRVGGSELHSSEKEACLM